MGGLRPAHIPRRPFSTISLDLITGLPPSGDEQYTAILVIVDKLTKYALFLPTHDELNREDFATLFFREVVNRYGLPERLISDRDPRWATDFWKSVAARYGAKLALSSSHHPQTDGQTENLNHTLETMLRAYVAQDRTLWAQYLSEMAFAYNSSKHGSTGYRPDFLLMGYEPRQVAGLMLPGGDPAARPFLPSMQAEMFTARLELHRQLARDHLARAQDDQARSYNKNRRPVDEFKEGDLVMVNPHTMRLVDAKGKGVKLVQRTIGPFEVLQKISPVAYRLRLPSNYPMHPVLNIEHLRRYRPSPEQFGERTQLPPTRDLLDADEEYEVEAILGHKLTRRKKGNNRMYLVRWRGYEASEDSWISEYDLRNAPELKQEYHALRRLPL